jgi:drug/metabolite transporter (DMT)-like permease
MNYWLGGFFVFISSLSFGAMALFARVAYGYGVSPVTLLFFRFALGALCMGLIVLIRKERFPALKTSVGLFLMGAIGYSLQSFSFFTALTMANVGLVSLLLFLYPAIVAVLSRIIFKELLTPVRTFAILLAFSGTALIVGPSPAGSPLGIALGVNAALVYSLYIMAGTHLLKSASPITGSLIIMTGAAVVFGFANGFLGLSLPSAPLGWAAIFGVALISTVIAVTFFLIGIASIGPTRASILSTFEPIFTVLLAAMFLQEPIGVTTILGGLAILGASILLSVQPQAPRVVPEPDIN